MKVCKKHKTKPVYIYHNCVGCELEYNEKEIKKLKEQLKEFEAALEVVNNKEKANER